MVPKASQREPKGCKREPKVSRNGAKGSPKGATWRPKGAKSEPTGDQNASKNQSKIDLRIKKSTFGQGCEKVAKGEPK